MQPACVTCLPSIHLAPSPPSWNPMSNEWAADRAFVRAPLPPSWNLEEQEVLILDTSRRLVDSLSFDVRLIGKICSYLSFESDWDGEGAISISSDAVDDCLSFLNTIPPDVGPPNAMPLPGGEISLYWDRGSTYAEISFDGSHSFCAYAKGPKAEPIYIDRSAINLYGDIGSFPRAIRMLLINN